MELEQPGATNIELYALGEPLCGVNHVVKLLFEVLVPGCGRCDTLHVSVRV